MSAPTSPREPGTDETDTPREAPADTIPTAAQNPAPGASHAMPEEPPCLALGRELGAGAAGTVHLARLTETYGAWPPGTEVAVKRLHPEVQKDPTARASLDAEADAGRRVSHPSLARVLFAGRGADGPLLVTEYVEGHSLREVLGESGPLPEPLLRHVGAQLAGALEALHAVGLVHGDVKPENVRLDPVGRAVLVDLGFARSELPHGPGKHGSNGPGGGGPGSLPYLAPERVRGAPPTRASDVWALGVTLWELAVGSHPLLSSEGPTEIPSGRASSSDELLEAIGHARFAPPSRRAPLLSPFFDQLADALLAREPERRPTAGELARILSEGEVGPWWRQAVESRAPGAASGRPIGGAHLTPLVGRDAELAQLTELWRRALQGEPAVALVEGSAGGGKSRLISELADNLRAGEEPPLYLYTRCSELIEAQPYGALLVALRRWLQLPASAPVGQREENALRSLLSPGVAETLLRQLTPSAEERPSHSLSAALAEWLRALTAERALIFCVDDLRHAGETTLRALLRLLRDLSRERLLLVLVHRSDEPPSPALARFLKQLERTVGDEGRWSLERLERISLPPLDREAVLDLVTTLFHHTTPRLRLAEELWKRSRGNPGLLAEVLRDLIDTGRARPVAGSSHQYTLEVAPDDLPLPGSLQRTITRRYRQLPPELRFWLRRLAVVGGRIAPDFLVRAFPPASAEEIGEVLAELVHTGWLVPAGGRYRFARPALREAVYRSLSADRRQRLHAAAARALGAPPSKVAEGTGSEGLTDSASDAGTEHGESPPPPRSSFEEYQRAFHLRAAGRHSDLLELVVPLLGEHRALGQAQRVHSLARWGIEALDSLPEGETGRELALEFLVAAADAADRLGHREEERRLLDRLAELVDDPAADPGSAARVYLLHGRYAASTGQYGLARGMLRNAVEFAATAAALEPDSTKRAALSSACLRRLALVQSHVGDAAEAREMARAAIARAQGPEQRALGWLARAQVEVLDDRVEAALRAVNRAHVILHHASKRTPPGILATALMLRARVLRAAGRPARAHASARRALRLARLSGERRLEAEAGARLGGVLLDLDRPAVAEAYLRDALYTADEIEDRRGRALAQVWLGVLLWEENDPEAREHLQRAASVAEEMGFYRAEALSLSVLARLHRAAGRRADALAASARALALVERHGAELIDRVVITGTRALVLGDGPEKGEAREIVRTLRRRMRHDNARIHDPALRRDHRRQTTKLLEGVLSPEGNVYPRESTREAEE